MKIRNGFVSNSSTSSFCIYGAQTEIEDDDDDGSKLEAFEKKAEKAGLEVISMGGDYDNATYIGKSWSSVGDSETGKQFKDKIEKAIEEVLGKKTACETLSEAWHD